MTIGIGVLCSSKPRPHEPRPDALVMIADTMGSTETDSIDELHKMYWDDATRVHFTCAGQVEMAAELVPMFTQNFSQLQTRSHGTITEALNIAVHGHRVQHFNWDVIAKRHSCLMSPTPGMLPIITSDQEKILEEWQNYDVGLQMLVGTFDDTGQALLYFIGKQYISDHEEAPGMVHLREFPGHATIGTGSYNATFWLNYRQQTLGRSIKQSAYQAYEAKAMAAKSPTVNSDIEIIVATAEKSWYLSKEKPEAEGCGVSLLELQQMFKKYGPQNTDEIGHKPNPSVSRKSAGSNDG